jgi:tRNA modification GTPase
MSTIAAISTPRGVGGISVIRISGEDAIKIAGEIFVPVSTKKSPDEMEGYTCAYGKIVSEGEFYDDVMLTVFRSPKSYTGEDTAEISCHGGIFVTESILQLIYAKGACPAKAGEFTKRAFLNGKMNLTEAEAVMDMISAEGRASHRCAAALREGALFSRINAVSVKLIHLLGEIGAWVDYPEEDIPDVDNVNMVNTLTECSSELENILSTYDYGKIIREGVDTAIVGKPNVGKSTLMNLLSGCERSIVTDIAGTTRDVIEESVRLGDIVLRLSDTAGIRDTDDVVEGFGVKKAGEKIETAELVLAVFDNSEGLTKEDIEIADKCSGKNAVAVINKTDLDSKLDTDYITSHFASTVYISAGNGDGIIELQSVLTDMFKTNSIDYNAGILANERQRECVRNSLKALNESIESARQGYTLDAVNILIDEAENYLLELTGERASEAVVNEVFSHFCVGK